MVLAAGLGSRMSQGGEARPKPLVELGGAPLIKYSIAAARKAGFDEVVINLHHRADEVQGQIGAGRELGVRINWLFEPEILGTGGGVKNANRVFPAQNWLILNADSVTDLGLKSLLYFHKRYRPAATMVLTQSRKKYNPVYTDSLGRVRRIGNFPETLKEEVTLSKFAFCGIQVVSGRLLDYLPEGFSRMIEDGYFRALEKGDAVLAHVFHGLWLTFDEPQSLSQAGEKYAAVLARLLR